MKTCFEVGGVRTTNNLALKKKMELNGKRISRREFCAEIAATAAVAIPSFSALAGDSLNGLKPLIKYRGGKSKEFNTALVTREYSLLLQRTEIPILNFYGKEAA